MFKRGLAVAAALLATTASADLMKPGAPAVAGPTIVRGTIVSVEPATVTVRSDGGIATVIALAPGFKVAALTKIGLDAIQPNSFIGTAARPGRGGVLEATEVHVFPESMRGLGEGHYDWDKGPRSTMTNGNVARVGTIKHHAGRTLTVDYKGGSQQVVVPAGVPVVAFADGTPAQLQPGAHVFLVTTKTAGGWPATNQLAVGIGGVVPPM